MLSLVNRDVHLVVKVETEELTINGLAEWVFARTAELVEQLLSRVVTAMQTEALARVRAETEEMVCRSCGVVHQGAEGWSRRGMRVRQIKTSRGEITLPLLQVTCLACGNTRTPFDEALGLEPRQRSTTELRRKAVEQVYGQSYRAAAEAVRDCMGVRLAPSTVHRYVQRSAAAVELRPDPSSQIIVADGTKARAGTRTELEDLRMAFQLSGRSGTPTRPQAHLRLVGLGVGLGTWAQVLPGDTRTTLVVTDAEAALESHIRTRYPNARHQYCEWHLPYSLRYTLLEDGVRVAERKPLCDELAKILWGKMPRRQRRKRYMEFVEQRLSAYPKSQNKLRRALPHILFPRASAETTTSLIERQMREVDRRAWIGVRWSPSGLRNLLLLKLARRHNPDDYARVWMN